MFSLITAAFGLGGMNSIWAGSIGAAASTINVLWKSISTGTLSRRPAWNWRGVFSATDHTEQCQQRLNSFPTAVRATLLWLLQLGAPHRDIVLLSPQNVSAWKRRRNCTPRYRSRDIFCPACHALSSCSHLAGRICASHPRIIQG